ncbi:MAG: sensor histidine kinase [Candidatus Methylomirabilales bacterium]
MSDTLKQLVQAFDRMAESYRLIAERVGRRLDELEDVHGSLKDYVRQLEERTGQLSESNTGLCAKVTELEALAQALHQQNEVLQARERQKSDFLTTLSHQVRTPLTVIEGSLRLLFHEKEVEPAARHEFLTMAHQHVDRLIRLIGNFLNLTRIETGQIVGERRELDLSLLVKRTIDQLRPVAINRHMRIDLEQPPKRVLVQGDAEMLESVLINLVDNAVKFSGQGKVVQVKVEETPTEALVHVTDQGLGVPSEELDRIFEQFYRIALPGIPKTAGSGLGLYVSKLIVEAHEGRIWGTSEVGRGSTFSFALPRSASMSPVMA